MLLYRKSRKEIFNMLSCDTEIYNFQNYLLGETKKFQFKPSNISEEEKKKLTLKIVKWVIEDMLGWTPKEASEHFGEKEVKTYKLTSLLDNFFSGEGMGKRNYLYMLSLIYPESIEYDASKGIIEIWDNILENRTQRFPTNHFIGEQGRERAFTLLDEFNKRYVPAADFQELYKKYGESNEINNLLRTAKLYTSLSRFCNYPIQLLHQMLQEKYPGEENEYLYAVYLYKNVAKNAK